MFDKEFIDESLGSKLCTLLIIKSPSSETQAINFLTRYLKSKFTKRVIGFDLEFNTPPGSKGQRQIAIFQISFYLKKYILTIFFNPKLVTLETNQLIHKLLIAPNIMKIGHGTDSLDIPAIYGYLNDTQKIIDFTCSLYDTRFLCEFENILLGTKLCNIYHLLEKFQVITPKQLKWLKTNEEKLGEFWRKTIDLTNLPNGLRDYSMYDALYLKRLLVKMKRYFKLKKWDYNLVIQTTRLVFLIKREIIKFNDISYLNLYYLSNKSKLYDLFYIFYNDWLTQLETNQIGILGIGYFKNQLIKILSHGFYLLICSTNQVNKSSHQILGYEQIAELKDGWNKLNNYLKLFPKVNKLIIDFLKFVKSRL